MPTIPNPPYHTKDHNTAAWLEWFRTHRHKPILKYIYPTSITVPNGTLSAGVVTDLHQEGGNQVVITEIGTTPGFRLDINFAGNAMKPIGVVTRAYYNGSPTHDVQFGAVNQVLVTNERYFTLPSRASFGNYSFIFTDWMNYAQTPTPSTVVVNFIHNTAGTPGHTLVVDYCALVALETE